MTDPDNAQTARLAENYIDAAPGYFEKRGLQRHAGLWSLWALGVGAVISGHFSGWILSLAAGGLGGMLIAAAIMAVMFLALSLCIAEMSTTLPLNGGSYPLRALRWGRSGISFRAFASISNTC